MVLGMKRYKIILISIMAVLLLIQIFPVQRTNPPSTNQPNWDSPKTKEYFDRACLDCHSNHTKWPWYSYVAPVSWLLISDVDRGRSKFNISNSDMGEYDEAAEEVEKGYMPIPVYIPIHPEAKLSEVEKKEFIEGLKRTFGKKKEGIEDYPIK
jgi:hypothetical protein